MIGGIENGQRLPVRFGEYDGPAGVRNREGGREVAFMGKRPAVPLTGTIDGQEATATDLIRSSVPRFVVLWVPDPVAAAE